MKTRLMEYLAAYLERGQARQRQRWQRTRSRGRTRYILLMVLYLWIAMVTGNVFAIWIGAVSTGKLVLPPHRTLGEILVIIIFGTVGSYFAGASSWRLNERRYGNSGQE